MGRKWRRREEGALVFVYVVGVLFDARGCVVLIGGLSRVPDVAGSNPAVAMGKSGW